MYETQTTMLSIIWSMGRCSWQFVDSRLMIHLSVSFLATVKHQLLHVKCGCEPESF